MRIGIVTTNFYPKIDGMVRVAHDHARKLAERGHDVYIVAGPREGVSSGPLSMNGITVILAKPIPSLKSNHLHSFFRILAIRNALLKLANSLKGFDIIYSIGLVPLLSCLQVKLVTNTALILSYQGREDLTFYSQIYQAQTLYSRIPPVFRNVGLSQTLRTNLLEGILKMVVRVALKKVDALIFPSDTARKSFRATYGRSFSGTEKIIPNGVDCQRFASKESQRSAYVLYVGALSRRKGVDLLLRAAPEVLQEFPDVKFILIGEGRLEGRLKTLAQDLRVNDSVHFLKRVEDDVLLSYYRKSSVVVVPTYFDAFPSTVLEAMAAGNVVISTLGSSPAKVIGNSGAGILIRSGDHTQLSEAIRKVLRHPDLRREIGRKARSIAQSYELEKTIDELEESFFRVKANGSKL